MAAVEPARVYTISGASAPGEASYNSTSLPDILRRAGSSNKRKKRRAAVENDSLLSKIELIQDFEFPEASMQVRVTRDGRHVMATGTYKPQIRVWECEQLSLKYERHTDAENVDFIILSDDWTKSLHLQSDRSLALHGQGGIHTSVRLPRFGRALGYHFPTADALVGAAGNEVYRLNLHQGQYLAPFVLGSRGNRVLGCNAIDVNPAHGLLSFGTEGSGDVELWDPRMRRQAGALSVATNTVLDAALLAARRRLPGVVDAGNDEEAVARASQSLAVTALASADDGLNLAVGTNTGHVLLYDLRMDRPYTSKDQGFGLPIHSLAWPGDRSAAAAAGTARDDARSRAEADGTVLSADAKVVKVWDRQSGENVVSIPAPGPHTNINHVTHYPGTGLLFAAVEATQMAAWYVPALGPAPRWCSFVDNVTDEMDATDAGAVGGSSGAHAYEDFKFVDQAELERLSLTHLVGTALLRPYMHGYFLSLRLYERARLLAHPTEYEEAKQRAVDAKLQRAAESRVHTAAKPQRPARSVRVNRALAEKLVQKDDAPRAEGSAPALLDDPRFRELFTNPEFQVDESTREFALLNPSSAPAAPGGARRAPPRERAERTLVPAAAEALESDTESLDPDEEEARAHDVRASPPRHLPVRASVATSHAHSAKRAPRLVEEEAAPDTAQSLGERATQRTGARATPRPPRGAAPGAAAVSWTPSASTKEAAPRTKRTKAPADETFAAGLSKGAGAAEGYGVDALSEQARSGRKQRRKPGRSASGNAMRAASR
ncbi:Small ribosomal subunit biogenesis [Malassezia sp. CBS 17886]|nr:Small ribosomal subunit biogenesis [Malassezia sp. CBS 17886]